MMLSDNQKAISVLIMNTLSFAVCFACWMMYGVLITFLIDNGVYQWDKAQVGLLIGIPVLTGSICRLPVGLLTDKYGGRPIFIILMVVSAIAIYSVSFADSFIQFLLAGLGFGVSGASFAVGVAYTSLWFPKKRQGTVLGIFGAGNMGAALTSIFAPTILMNLTNNLANIENWRILPKIYAALLIITTLLFCLFTFSRKIESSKGLSLIKRLEPLKTLRVWRFGFYYFLVFGGFIAISQWLIPYYLNVYLFPLTLAGLLASIFSLPAGIVRGLGGWMSDRLGARSVMFMVLAGCLFCSVLLSVPRLDIESPGEGVMATAPGKVVQVTPRSIQVDKKVYTLIPKPILESGAMSNQDEVLVLPRFSFWQEPIVHEGDIVKKKQLLARGVTHIYFQANVWIFTGLILILGILMGIGSAAVYRYIPDYFPDNVGVVGGIVGVLGGLGGFLLPIIFGYLLNMSGIWTTCWFLMALVSLMCLWWLNRTVSKMIRTNAPELMQHLEAVRHQES